jgi:hypothetical protein
MPCRNDCSQIGRGRPNQLRPTFPRLPGIIPVALSAGFFHAAARLDGLLRHRPCRFISPRSRVQGSPFRGFFLQRCRTDSSSADSLVPLGLPACGPGYP